MSYDSTKKILLRSSDGKTFEVEEVVARKMKTIRDMIEDDCGDNEILLPNVMSSVLSKVIDYCKKHMEEGADEEYSDVSDLKAWDTDFIKVDKNTLFDLILAAKYLKIKSLLDLTCSVVADLIKGMTPEEIRKFFNIKNEFTPEEEEEARRQN